MYIDFGGRRYACTGTPVLTGDTLRFCLPEGAPELAGDPAGTIGLYRDDDFQLWEAAVDGYLRWGVDGDSLVVTNLPEAEPVPEPEPGPVSTEVTADQLAEAVVGLMYEIDQLKLGGNLT